MKWLFIIIPIIIVVPAGAQPFSAKEFKPLHALTGLWKMETSRGSLYEEWLPVNENKLAGRSFRINNKDTLVLEQLEIFLQENEIICRPVVFNQNNGQPVSFRLISAQDNRYVFENREHDFPQRIIYHLVSENSIRARIEGVRNGEERGSDFIYSRVK